MSFLAISAVSFLFTGCTVTNHPRPRPGSYASSTIKVKFIDEDKLGSHNFGSFVGENDGIAYTCKGGDIDIAHLRIAADNVYYLYNKITKHLENGDTDFDYKLNTDSSSFKVHITYPPGFKNWSAARQRKVIDEVALDASQYCTWNMVTWHEVLTWFGMRAFIVVPQFESAFSWEDSYSNLLGTILGARAIRHPDNNFNADMTAVLKDELKSLGVQPAGVAYYASEKMRDKWFTGSVDVHIQLRNFDLGLDDGYVSPCLVPDICPTAKPLPQPVPKLDIAKRYGFKFDLQITGHGLASHHCFEAVFPNGNDGPIIPAKHMPIIMKCIRAEAKEMGLTAFP